MHYVIAGSTGTVGRALTEALIEDDHRVTVLTRRPDRARRSLPAAVDVVSWSVDGTDDLAGTIRGVDAVINLAGAGIGGRPWTAGRKRDILESRVSATRALVAAIASLPAHDRPKALINASGIDYYGDQPTRRCVETSPPGESFLADVCRSWEAAAFEAEALGVRVVVVRTAFVVARDAPAFRLLTLPFRAFVGGPLGSGAQPFTWIHIDDLVVLYRYAAANGGISGPLNAVAPDVPSQAAVATALGRALHRPSGIRVPARVLRVVMGDQADLLLHGRLAEPRVALDAGYAFRHPTLAGALDDVLGPRPRPTPMTTTATPFGSGELGRSADSLPEAFRIQFLGSPEDGSEAVLVGTMDRVWHRHAWLRPLFSLMARTDLLFPETGDDVPATMVVRNHRDGDGLAWQTWERRFDFDGRQRRFDGRLSFDATRGRTVEHTGPGGRLEVPWQIEVDGPSIHIDATSIGFRIGRRRLPIPRLLSVAARAVEIVDPSHPDRIHIDLRIANPILGPIFGYEGTFSVARQPSRD